MPPKPAKKPPAAELEYCELCFHHHDLGRRHRYCDNHRKKLGKVLNGFSSKLSDLRRALLDGSHSSQAPRPRLWCPFCSTELVDLDNGSACSSAIYHLASGEHLKAVKDFLWKHGGGRDQVDSLRISEDELAKWEKGCESLSKGAKTGTEGLIGPSLGPMKDIQNESTCDNLDSFTQTNIPSFSNTSSYVVMPLQSPTNGAYHPISTACHGAFSSGSVPYSAPYGTVGLPIAPRGSSETHEQRGVLSTNCFHSTGPEMKGHHSTILGNGPSPSISCAAHVQQSHSRGNLNSGPKANVHTGAPPPWLKANEHDPKNLLLRNCGPLKGKSRKLNPKRVGAAWAERRRAEMEMEKRGEVVPETSDSSWLPNFGGVWQSGTRKESRKDFEKRLKHHDTKSNHELPLEIKPYISKRMRVGVDKASDKSEQLGSHMEQWRSDVVSRAQPDWLPCQLVSGKLIYGLPIRGIPCECFDSYGAQVLFLGNLA